MIGIFIYSDIENCVLYDVLLVGFLGGYGGIIGKDQKGIVDNVNLVFGISVLSKGGVLVVLLVVMGVLGDVSLIIKSGVSGGMVMIIDGVKQQ